MEDSSLPSSAQMHVCVCIYILRQDAAANLESQCLRFCPRGINVSPSLLAKFSVQSWCLHWEDGVLLSRRRKATPEAIQST